MKLVVGLIFLMGCQLAIADTATKPKKSHIKVKKLKKVSKSYDYKFSSSAIGSSLEHLLRHSNGSVYEGKLGNYNKHLKVIKSNPSASFLELRLFYAHLGLQDKKEKQFVVHLMRQLNHPLTKDFLSQNTVN